MEELEKVTNRPSQKLELSSRLDSGVLKSIICGMGGRLYSDDTMRIKQVMWSLDTLRSVTEDPPTSLLLLEDNECFFFFFFSAINDNMNNVLVFASDSVQNEGKFPKMAA